VRYVGGKARIAKWIRDHIVAIADEYRGMSLTYVEPFVGSGAVLEQIVRSRRFSRVVANDVHPDLIRMWHALSREGWTPPKWVSKEEHARLKNSEVPGPLRGYAGFCCSFGGSFFSTHEHRLGRRGNGIERVGQDGEWRSVTRRAKAFRNVELLNTDYGEVLIPPASIVYCDPPYIGTTGYSVGEFDHIRFWRTMDQWVARGAIVFVSEYVGPWSVLDEITIHSKLAHSFGDKRLERLFLKRPGDA
jgi:DNA adenine methylase